MRPTPCIATLLAALCYAAPGCTPDFDPVYRVLDLRILALQADPPEVLLPSRDAMSFPPVTVRALVVDPRLPKGATLRWELSACTPEGLTCDDAALSVPVTTRTTTLDQIQTDFTIQPALLQAAVLNDNLRGFGGVPVKVQLKVWEPGGQAPGGQEPVVGIKRLVYAFQDQPLLVPALRGALAGSCRDGQTPCEAGLTCDGRSNRCLKVPNANPAISVVEADGAPLPATDDLGQSGETVELLPQSLPEDQEIYWAYTFEGGSTVLKEYLEYAFFVTSGELQQERTGGRPSAFATIKRVTDLSNDWTLGEPGPATLWIVARDDRGGVSWTTQPVTVR